jgi:mRNA-degrading endonuclease RelE of RelBE toxin-antitoxin system
VEYKIIIDKDALHDIQAVTDWYNTRLTGLGKKFQSQVKSQINSLKHNPNIYSIRYNEVRCLIVKKYPYMVHFKVDDKNLKVEIFAVIHTSRNPEIWDEGNKDIK